ncbi:MAG: carbohydrate kinase [Flavobacterium sp.]|nr:carbohydrate kinase [Pedobacter sp.]
MNNQVLCFGEVLWDTFPEGEKPGGAPLNVAAHLKQQGINSILASRLGRDKSGDDLCIYLKEINLFSELIQFDDALPTCTVTVMLDPGQQASYTIPYPVSWDRIQPDEPLIKIAKNASVIVFGSLVCRDKVSKETLTGLLKSKALKVFDVNIRAPHFEMNNLKSLGGMSDVIKMNSEELDMLAGTELAHLTEKEKILFISDFLGCKTICITRGGAGALVYMNNQFYEHPGYKVEVVDTVGAGDAFLATFITGILTSQTPDLILGNACAIGAFVASSRGANPDYDQSRISAIRAKVC